MAVASSILGQISRIDPPDAYTANAQFGGALFSVFRPDAYDKQRRVYGDNAPLSLSSEPSLAIPRQGNYGGYLSSPAAQNVKASPACCSTLPQDMYRK